MAGWISAFKVLIKDLFVSVLVLIVCNLGLFLALVQIAGAGEAAAPPSFIGKGYYLAAGGAMFFLLKAGPAYVLGGLLLERFRVGKVSYLRLITVTLQFALWMALYIPEIPAVSQGEGSQLRVLAFGAGAQPLRELVVFLMIGSLYSYLWLVLGANLYYMLVRFVATSILGVEGDPSRETELFEHAPDGFFRRIPTPEADTSGTDDQATNSDGGGIGDGGIEQYYDEPAEDDWHVPKAVASELRNSKAY